MKGGGPAPKGLPRVWGSRRWSQAAESGDWLHAELREEVPGCAPGELSEREVQLGKEGGCDWTRRCEHTLSNTHK